MKQCSKCNESKPRDEFYAGRGKCKLCCSQQMAEIRARDPDAWRARNLIYQHNYEQRDPKRKASRRENWRARNPQKRKAHNAVAWALHTGTLVREPCEVCGSERSQAHHEDYSKPLTVRWLCSLHHVAAHSGEAGRSS